MAILNQKLLLILQDNGPMEVLQVLQGIEPENGLKVLEADSGEITFFLVPVRVLMMVNLVMLSLRKPLAR